MNEIILGLGVVIIAAVLQGSFIAPMSNVKSWKWENSWAIFSILGMFVFNWILSFLIVPSLGQIYHAASLSTLSIPAVFGILWGFGAICFGLGMTAVGLALGYAIIMGLVLSCGAFIPMIVLHPADFSTPKGILVVIGLLVMIIGIILFGQAGIRKEAEQAGSTGKITRGSGFSMKVGLLICIAAGLLSCLTNVGFALSKDLVQLALEFKTGELWAGNAIWFILFSFGGIVNLAYCVYLFKKNKSFSNYFGKESFKNLLLIGLMSLMWIGSFVIYGVGARMMGTWGTVIGWSVFIALSIAIGGFWGIAQGEWTKTTFKVRKLAYYGISILLAAILIFAYSGTK